MRGFADNHSRRSGADGFGRAHRPRVTGFPGAGRDPLARVSTS